MTLTRGIAVARETRRPPTAFPAELQSATVVADIIWMLRVLSIPAVLIALFVGSYLSMKNMQSNGPTSAAGQQDIAQAQSATAGVNFSQAVPGLQTYFDHNHTYVSATLPPGSGVVLVSADATSYCLQDGNEHEVGPGGTPQPGPC